MKEHQRVAWVDMAKGYGILCVIFSHIIASQVNSGNFSGQPIVVLMHSFHMPLFFFLSGYVFNTKRKWRDFLFQRMRTILLPYFFFAAVIALATFMFKWMSKELSSALIEEILIGIFVQKRLWTIWYLTCLFVVEIVAYSLVSSVKSDVWLGIVAVVLPVIGLLYYKCLGGDALPWNVDICFMALPFFLAGYFAKKYIKHFLPLNIRKPGKIAIVSFTVLTIVAASLLSFEKTGEMLDFFKFGYGMFPLTYIIALAGIWVVILLSKTWTFKSIQYLGQNTMLYFAIHQAIAMPFVSLFLPFSRFEAVISAPVLAVLVWALAQLLVIVFLLTICNEIVIRIGLGWLLGKPSKK